MTGGYERTFAAMGTVVSIRVVTDDPAARAAVERAAGWFLDVERTCSRFDASSELRRVTGSPAGTPVQVTPLLAQVTALALAVAERSSGAFDPTVGAALEARGFDVEFRSGRRDSSGVGAARDASWRDVRVDVGAGTIALGRPLLLDLGGVAKGFAVDLAAAELAAVGGFAVDAGGDLRVGGPPVTGESWTVAVRHPRAQEGHATVLALTDAAVCTSGAYERAGHLIDPRTGADVTAVASATVVAPTAAVADALATAALVLGAREGRAFLEEQGVEGLLIDAGGDFHRTPGFAAHETNAVALAR